MAIDTVRDALVQERDDLRAMIDSAQQDLKRVERALAALEDGGTPRPRRARRPKYSKEQLTCVVCGFVAKAPQGLGAHKRRAHPSD
jgi:hypothetical protein